MAPARAPPRGSGRSRTAAGCRRDRCPTPRRSARGGARRARPSPRHRRPQLLSPRTGAGGLAGELLDDSYSPTVRRDIPTLTVARTAANALYRFAPVVLATIASGLDVSIGQLGVALTIAELCGFASPLVGRFVDRMSRRRGDDPRPRRRRHGRRRGRGEPARRRLRGRSVPAVAGARSCSTSARERGSPTTSRSPAAAGWSASGDVVGHRPPRRGQPDGADHGGHVVAVGLRRPAASR